MTRLLTVIHGYGLLWSLTIFMDPLPQSQPPDETLRRSGREVRPPTHLEDYAVQYSGARGAACQTECTHHTQVTDTHGHGDNTEGLEEEQEEHGHERKEELLLD